MTPVDQQPFFPLSLPPKDKLKLPVSNATNVLPKRQSRRTVTVLDGKCRVSSAENDRYQLSRQNASVSSARRNPLGRTDVAGTWPQYSSWSVCVARAYLRTYCLQN
ncbi:unnamed protein product [Litomosoides sigmodontis]|uniref:Uncharacterized protein n=1 Tax=Litomosoides sigmodontis TaxID=42156 RepID=A0A3P6SPB3_LITSI|nr:unnamed protein product [Litomosoides sigmodontis]